jgi:hypothetical protein
MGRIRFVKPNRFSKKRKRDLRKIEIKAAGRRPPTPLAEACAGRCAERPFPTTDEGRGLRRAPPKAPISERAFTTDMKGQFCEKYEPLDSLKQALHELHEKSVPRWKLRSESLMNQLHYPITSSSEEWADEIMALEQLLATITGPL